MDHRRHDGGRDRSGLAVNVVCALILGKAHHHGHAHGHGHSHDHGTHHHAHEHHDLNLKSAYLHVLADTAKVLLDREMDHPVVDEIREVVETGPQDGDTRIADLHVWRVGQQAYACALTVVTHDRALTPDVVRQRLSVHEEIVHATIEVHWCPQGQQAIQQQLV